jgi:hypothetical protein
VRQTAIAGECGGDGRFGFVAVADLESDKLQWLAFFRESNPFEMVQVEQNRLHAVTNLGVSYLFLVDDPTSITIVTP